MTTAPGIMVSTPAAASSDQSMPDDRIGARHHGGERQRVGRRQRRRQQLLDPREHEAEERGDADAVGDQRQEDPDEEARERIAVDRRRLVDLARHAADEAFENPHRQRHVEEAMRQRDGPDRVEQADRVIEIEERHREDRRRRHQIGQQPEEQMLVADEAVAVEGVGGRQRDRRPK